MEKQKFPNKQSRILNNKYEIVKILKSGGFASVYYAKSLEQAPNKFAIKFMPKKYKRYAIMQDKIYKLIKEKKYTFGFIKHYETGQVNDQLYLVMQLVGYDLQEVLYKVTNRKFNLKTVLMIGLQLIDRIQALHSIGYIHRDIKPDNLTIGNKQKNNIIYLLDFGLVVKQGEPMPSDEKGKIIGTLGFMGIRAHQMKRAIFWDDIESLVYTLIYFLQGSLPWMQINVKSSGDYQKIKTMKQKLNKQWFKRHNIPCEIYDILCMSRQGTEKQKIDYLSIKYKLLAALNNINEKNDFKFDWSSVIKITHDSPAKRVQQRQKVNQSYQSNQKEIQKEIYEIYKFINDENQKNKVLNINKQSKEKIKNLNPLPYKKYQQKKGKQVTTPKKQIRPNSVNLNRGRIGNQKTALMNKVQKQMKLMQDMKFEGPKIVINRTAAHKI